MRKVTEQEKSVVFCQASGVRKIPQLKADILHGCSLRRNTQTHTYLLLISNNMKSTHGQLTRLQDWNKNKQCEEMTHRWYFVSVENKCYAATTVVQMPTVWLALGGCLWGCGSGHGANPPVMARRRKACEVAVLHTLPSSRAGMLSLVLA